MASRLALSHIEAGLRLREALAAASDQLWRALGSYDRDDVPRWLEQILPVALAGQRTAAVMTSAYLAQALGREPLLLDPAELTGPAIRNGAEPEEVYERPLHTVWMGLGAGLLWEDAVEAGRARAAATITADAQLAMRQTAAAVQTETGIAGYRRVANAGACPFCMSIDGAFVKSASAFPLHPGCSCGLEPVERREKATPLPDDVAVSEHGELGPTLHAPEHHFEIL